MSATGDTLGAYQSLRLLQLAGPVLGHPLTCGLCAHAALAGGLQRLQPLRLGLRQLLCGARALAHLHTSAPACVRRLSPGGHDSAINLACAMQQTGRKQP